MKPTISKPFKSNDRTFDKVYNAFDKRDYFNSQGLAKVQIGNFERALQKNDKGAQQVLDLFKGDEKKAKDYITQVVSDRNKERAFNNYKAMKDAVDSIQKGKPNVGAVDYVKRIIHNSSQKYSIALYSTLRNKKFTKWKDVHNDIDDLIGESVNEAMNVSELPNYIFDDPDDFEDWYNGGMKLKKKGTKLSAFSKSDERKLFGFVEDWIESRDDNRYGHGSSSDIKRDIKDIEKFLKQKGKVIKESVNEGISVFDERHFGKKGIIIMIDDNGKKVSAIFKDKKNADKFNRNKPSDIKKLLQLAKKTKFPKAIDESINENFPNMKKWWKEDKKDVMSFIYYLQRQLPPNNKDKYEKAWVSIAKQLQKKTPAPNNIYKKIVGESVNEGKKRYYQQDRVGSAKYTISYHDGKKKHKDGSDFFDIQTFKNKKDLAKFVNTLHKGGYVYGFNESVNEAKEPEVISQLRDIVKRKQNKKIKDPISGKMMRVDLYSASAITQVYDAINKSNKDKFGKLSLPKMVNVAFSVIKKESVHEGKYNYKKDALTDYFRGKLSAKELDKIARDDFNSGIATKKELSSFLSNKFTQDVMSDTYGIPVNTLIKRVRGLMKFAEGVNEMDPHYPVVSSDDDEVTESKIQINQLKKKVGKKEIKFYDALSKLEKKMGSRYKSFLDKSLKDFKLNPSKFRTNGDKEEKLFQVSEINTNEDLRNWFKKKWVNIGKKDKSGKHPPCGTSGKKSGYAKCVPAAKAASMSKKEKESATRRKRTAQNKAGRGGSQGGGGRKPINVSTHTGGKKSGTGKGS